MKVLVAVASKHSGTALIANVIGDTLVDEGMQVTVSAPEEVQSVKAFDAVIAGSGIYGGHWLKAAREFVERHAADLASRPVWLFSSGPIGDPPKPTEDPVDAAPMVEMTHALGHRVFAGVLDKGDLGMGERVIVRALRVPMGDFRDFEEVSAWAREIAVALRGHNQEQAAGLPQGTTPQ
jgi:menaquinone-dependent protoporphyrinogen oxidase